VAFGQRRICRKQTGHHIYAAVRAAAPTLGYTASGQLASVTDVIGLTSRFGYGTQDFLSSLTTPYGTTTFRHETTTGHVTRMIEATDPLGGTEHLEFYFEHPALPTADPAAQVPAGFAAYNTNLHLRTTAYWGTRAWALAPGDLSTATLTRWLLRPTVTSTYSFSAPVPHSRKRPLEGRVWFAYPGQTDPAQIGTSKRPATIGRVVDDGTSQVSAFTYNDQGQLTSVVDPLGRRTTYTYAANGIDLLEARQTTGGMNDLLATYGNYTATHRPQTIVDAAGQTTTATYNSAGQVLTITNPKLETTTFAYDTGGKLTSVTGAVPGAVTTIAYDGYGRPRTVTGPDGYATTTDYDLFDRATRVTYPDGTYEAWTYDRLDLATARDRAGRITRYFVDALRRPTATRDPLGRTVTQEWCGCGALEAIVDPNGNRTSWERDSQSRVTREVRANGSATSYVYETTTSRLKQRTDAKGQHTTYQYFLDGALKQVSYPNAAIATPTVSFTYDAAYGRLATMVDGIGTTSYTYRPMGKLGAGAVETVDGPLTNDTLTYGYDELGRIVSRALNGVTSTWAFDALGRLASQGDPIGTFTYAYDGATGRLQSLAYPNGQTSTYTYLPNAADRRFQEIHHKTPTGATLSRFAYTYDAVGNIATWTQQYEATTRAYDFTYDAADQLTGAVYRTTDPTPTILKRYGYVYDAGGNRTSEQIDDAPRTWTYDTMNRMTAQAGGGVLTFAGTVSEPATVTVQARPATVTGSNAFSGTAVVGVGTNTVAVTATDASGNAATKSYDVDAAVASETFSYDANGNLTAKGPKTYEWDAANRLVRVRDGASEIAAFDYDGYGRRVRKTKTGMTHVYAYDREDVLEERTTSGTSLRHVHGPGIDWPLATIDTGNSPAYYLADHLSSVVQATDGSANAQFTRQYDPSGRLTSGHDINGYAFTGREWDPQLNVYDLRARYYDPDAARFLAQDPIGVSAGINLYSYTLNNFLRFVDPFGLDIVVIENGPTRGNPIGHTAIGITGYGIFSFGNDVPLGSDIGAYLKRESTRRNTTVWVIKTTPQQDASAADRARSLTGSLGILTNNCSTRSHQILDAANIPNPDYGTTIDGTPVPAYYALPGTAGYRAHANGGRRFSIPQGGSVPSDLLQILNK
jgi:RHS repeat-associated protein